MEARFPNGSSVSRMWGDREEGELIGAFQYELDAIAFARAKIAEDAEQKFTNRYVVACTLRGTVRVIGPGAAES